MQVLLLTRMCCFNVLLLLTLPPVLLVGPPLSALNHRLLPLHLLPVLLTNAHRALLLAWLTCLRLHARSCSS